MLLRDKKKIYLICLIVGVFIVFCLMGSLIGKSVIGSSSYTKKVFLNSNHKTKKATRVLVEKGDTLWDIANIFYSKEYKDMNAFIDEIKSCNNMTSDTIWEGNYLIVPYYETEQKNYELVSYKN